MSVTDLIGESVVTLDGDGAILSWNAASAALYGWSAEEAVGRVLIDLVGRDDTSSVSGDQRRRRRDGAPLVVAVHRHPAGEGMVEVGRDVTLERRTERELALCDARNQSLFDALSAAFFELDFSGVGVMLRRLRDAGVTDWAGHFATNPEFVRDMMRAARHLTANDRALELFGCVSRTDLPDRSEPLWPTESTGDFAHMVVAMLERQPTASMRTKVRRVDGTVFPVFFATCEPAEALRTGNVRIAILDLTEHNAVERRLRESEQRYAALQDRYAHASKVALLGEFAATLAHEVNQPLAALSTTASAASRWLRRDPPDLERARPLMTRIAEDAARASAVVASVRAAATFRQPASQPVELPSVIREVAHFLGRDLREQGIELDLDVDACDGMVAGDRTQLQQVVVNLLTNAMQALSERKAGARHATVRCAQRDGELVMTVRDTGPGFPPNMGGSLFGSFFTTRPDGMGMGLAITRSICERHGGTVTASSDGCSGAEFTVTLPILAKD